LVERTPQNLNPLARWRDVRKNAFVHCFKVPFHGDQISRVSQVPNRVHVAGEGGNEWTHKVVPYHSLSLECSRGEVNHNLVRIVGEDLAFVGAFPCVKIFLDECADVFRRRLGGRSLHICSFSDVANDARPSGASIY